MKRAITAVVCGLVMAAPEGVLAQEWSGAFDINLTSVDRFSTDTAIVGSPFLGTSVGGYAMRYMTNGQRLMIDGRIEVINDEGNNDVDLSGPVHTGIFGIHIGRDGSTSSSSIIGGGYFGWYAAIGMFDGYDSVSPMFGGTIGIEHEFPLSSTSSASIPDASAFWQLGAIAAIGDPFDNEFLGLSGRAGISTMLGSRTSLVVDVETAYSPNCFEDCGGDWGLYGSLGFELAHNLGSVGQLVFGAEHQIAVANTEDHGTSTIVSLGFRIPFGGNSGRNNLTSPIGGFNAAGWMDPLD